MHRTTVIVALATLLFCRVTVAGAGVLLGFCDTYLAPDGVQHVHHGLDVSQASGSQLRAPLDGTVRFAGMTPGPQGGRVGVVTLETTAGVVSILPVEQFFVEAGSVVRAGDAICSVAATGDPSSAAPHAHIGLKVEGVYTDPSVLLLPVQEAAAPAQRAPDPASCSPAATPSDRVAAVVAPEVVASAVPSPQPVSQGVVSDVSAVAPDAPELAPGVTLAPAGQTQAPEVGADVVATVTKAAKSARGAGPAVDFAPRAAARGIVAVICSALFVAMLMASKTFSARVRRGDVSDRLGTLLQHLKAGDTLCELTSCPGPLPSQSRGH